MNLGAMCGCTNSCYGVTTISRLLKIIGLLCKRALSKRLYSAKETYDCKEPTNRSHPIPLRTNSYAQIRARDFVRANSGSQKSAFWCIYMEYLLAARTHTHTHTHMHMHMHNENMYGVATICRLLQITGLFCRIQSLS